MNFTKNQELAIETRGCSLLVAAGAGSGKTRVLIERIVRRLLDKECPTDITRFLIVTFTNAAADELSERVRRALSEKAGDPDEDVRRAAVRNLALLPQAKIGTIDSFCFDFVKQHFARLGLPPKLRIADETEVDVLLDGIIGSLVEEHLKDPDADGWFYTVYDMFSGKRNDAPFGETLGGMYKRLINYPSPKEYLHAACERYREVWQAQENALFDTAFGKQLYELAHTAVCKAIGVIEECLNESAFDEEMYAKFEPRFTDDLEQLRTLAKSLDAGETAAFAYFDMLKFGSVQVKRLSTPEAPYIYERRNRALSPIKELKKEYFSLKPLVIRLCAGDCHAILQVLSELLLAIDERMSAVKKEHGLVSFSDVERLTYSLLYDENGCETELAADAADGFDELYIDEYQDINPIQDNIFAALSRKTAEHEECGRFLVGDAKQSIYGFRGARPDIFVGYRAAFSDVSEAAPRRRVFMSNNFRCAENVIDFTNALFSRLLDDYDENERLIFSRIEEHPTKEPVEILLCDTSLLASRLADDRMRAEAEVVYRELIRLINDPQAIGADGKHFTLSDIAVLTGKWDAARFLERYLSERGVPVVCEKGESFFERREIRLALSVLEVADNPQKDIPLAGVLRSPIGGFGDDELVKVRMASPRTSFYEALCAYASSADETKDAALAEKTRRFLELVDTLRAMARGESASGFLRRMYAYTDLAAVCAAGTDDLFGTLSASARRKNLMLLYEKARAFDKTMFRGLSAFLDYIGEQKKRGDVKSCSEAAGGVRVMTVHKSKGLEFPVCFLFNADRKKSAPSTKYLMSDADGIAFSLDGYANVRSVAGKDGFVHADTPFRRLLKQSMAREETEEYKRLLYVALTRARDRLYITASPDGLDKLLEKAADDANELLSEGDTFLEWILGYAATEKPFEALLSASSDSASPVEFPNAAGRTVFRIRKIVCADETQAEETEESEKTEETGVASKTDEPARVFAPDEALLERIRTSIGQRTERISSFAAVPPKLTVSLLKHGLIDYEDALLASEAERKKRTVPLFADTSADAASRGTTMHVFMQFADFERCATEGCAAHAETLRANGFLSAEQTKLLDTEKLDGFFQTPLYEKIRGATAVYREMRFNLKMKPEEVLSGVPETDDFVLVQGVVDCFIENADGSYTVIDFKTDRVGENGEAMLVERYAGQLSLYCRAVREITEGNVREALIFSFDLMKEIALSEENMKGAFVQSV